jgi:hypothetical protein
VRQRFERLLANLQLFPGQVTDGETKHTGVVDTLNRAYWNYASETANRLLVGSWGKGTPVRPPRDIDVLFVLPVQVYHRFQQRTDNRQSQLLQEVKNVLIPSYPTTTMRGDGQVVVVGFDTYKLEVVPAYVREGGGYLICDTNNGGRYKWIDPLAEMADFNARDLAYNGNLRKLVQILKQWQRYCDVPIKSFHLEAMLKAVLPRVYYRYYFDTGYYRDYRAGELSEWWFDWLVRDVFASMLGWGTGSFTMPVTGETIYLGDAWLSKANTAYARAVKASEYEQFNQNQAAGDEWQKIFGQMVPQTVTW